MIIDEHTVKKTELCEYLIVYGKELGFKSVKPVGMSKNMRNTYNEIQAL